jgi:glycerophosphoryl diester phosphodiesterase
MRIPLPSGLLTKPIAHRALHDVAQARPENSRAAILAAMTHGYAIETDVQISAEGRAVVFHDEDLGRLTAEHGPIAARPMAELARIALLGSNETIPSLREILALIAGRVPLLIEIKDQTGVMGQSDGQLEASLAQDLAGYRGDVAVMSFNPHCVAQMARLLPQVSRGLTTSAYDAADWAPLPAAVGNILRDIPDYDQVEASFISHEAADLARPRVAALRRQGADILCWTIKSAEEEALAREYAQNITFEGYLAAHPA